MFIGGETTPPDPTTNTDISMSNANSIQSLTAALEELQSNVTQSFQTLNDAIVQLQNQQQVSGAHSDELAPFHAWLQVELTPFFGAKSAKLIVDKLNRSRAIGDFRHFTPVYKLDSLPLVPYSDLISGGEASRSKHFTQPFTF